MHLIPIYITEQQRVILFKRKEKTNIPVGVQVREAIDDYIIKVGGNVE